MNLEQSDRQLQSSRRGEVEMTTWTLRFCQGMLALAFFGLWETHDVRGSETKDLFEEESEVVFVAGEFSAAVESSGDQRIDSFLDGSGSILPAMARMRLKQQPDQPAIAPTIEQAEPTSLSLASTRLSSVFSASQASIVNQLSAERMAEGIRPGSDFVLGIESTILSTTDAGNLISKSNAVLGVSTEQRTPIVTYNVARGRHIGQQSGSGSYWFAARQDLDTLMSKIDSRIVDNFLVIQGPYSSLYGPGYAFFDVELLKAPRYKQGYQSHGRTSLDWKHNGDQWYGRETLYGGSNNWGYRVGYGHRTGNDYQTGDSLEMPSSYKSRDWDIALGWDPSSHEHIDFWALRLDQTDVEFPGQIYDMRYLVTDAYKVEYVNDCVSFSDELEAEVWYNRTRFEGDNMGAGKRRQIPGLGGINVDFSPFIGVGDFVGTTDVDAMSTGYSVATTWGCQKCDYLKVGTDLRFLKQRLNEYNSIGNIVGLPPGFPPQIDFANNPIANARSSNPGIYFERGRAVSSCWNLKMGGRMDAVATDSDPTQSQQIENSVGQDLSRDFLLYSGYLTADRKVGSHWTLDLGAGYAKRPPTLTELYADNPFIAVLPQLVVSRVIGNPDLEASGMWQMDVGLTANYSRLRTGARGFYAFIEDYITYDFLDDIGFGTSFNPVNTTLATLVGGELYGEYDFGCRWTGFTTLNYVEGLDRTRDNSIGNIRQSVTPLGARSGSLATEESLAVIAPLNGRAGLRCHDACPNPRWAVELAADWTNDQDKIATSLAELETPGYVIYDIRAYRQVSKNLLMTVGVENLFDRFYQQHFDPHFNPGANLGVFQPGRTFYTGIDWTY